MFNEKQKLQEIINSDTIDIQLALNILINSVSVNYNNFSKIDQYLISKSLECIKNHYDNKKDFCIKFEK